MKAMWMGFAAAIILAVAAGVVLNATGQTSAERFATSNVRL